MLHAVKGPLSRRVVGMCYIIRALCPRIWIPTKGSRLLTLFVLSSSLPPTILIVLLYPGSFASHGGEKINLRLSLSTYSIRWAQLQQALLDFTRDFDVSLMDNVVTTLYSGSGGKEVSDLIFHIISTLCLIACAVCLYLCL